MGSEKVTAASGPGVDFDHPAAAHVKILDHDKPTIDWQGRDKLAIVGFATSSREQAPFGDPAWIILGLNQLYRHIPRADAWMEIHANWNEHVVEGTDHQGWLANAPIPIFMTERVPSLPTSVRYPIERAIETFSDYFTSTIALALGLAVLEDFKTIGIWGVDLIVGEEYFHQKACAEYLIGFASARGIDVRLPAPSALCKSLYRYGYQQEPDWGPMRPSAVAKRLEMLKEDHRKALARAHWLDGRIAELQSLNGALGEEKVRERLEELQRERDIQLGDLHMLEGAARETDRWQQYLELHMRGGTVPP